MKKVYYRFIISVVLWITAGNLVISLGNKEWSVPRLVIRALYFSIPADLNSVVSGGGLNYPQGSRKSGRIAINSISDPASQAQYNDSELIIKYKYREAIFVWIMVLSLLILILFTGSVLFFYHSEEQKRKREEVSVQASIAELKQKALQLMMNPHFIFNIMNSIQFFVNQSDPKTANKILTGFAALTRQHLELCRRSMNSVQEELIYLKHYLSLQKLRFSDKMDYEIVVANEINTSDTLIPSMLIQPFLENAIWHGIMPQDSGGFIRLTLMMDKSDLSISIIDNGMGITNSGNLKTQGDKNHISRGISLIRQRIKLLNKLNNRQIQISIQQNGQRGTKVLIRIPPKRGNYSRQKSSDNLSAEPQINYF
jgi:hypothetical protein